MCHWHSSQDHPDVIDIHHKTALESFFFVTDVSGISQNQPEVIDIHHETTLEWYFL